MLCLIQIEAKWKEWLEFPNPHRKGTHVTHKILQNLLFKKEKKTKEIPCRIQLTMRCIVCVCLCGVSALLSLPQPSHFIPCLRMFCVFCFFGACECERVDVVVVVSFFSFRRRFPLHNQSNSRKKGKCYELRCSLSSAAEKQMFLRSKYSHAAKILRTMQNLPFPFLSTRRSRFRRDLSVSRRHNNHIGVAILLTEKKEKRKDTKNRTSSFAKLSLNKR